MVVYGCKYTKLLFGLSTGLLQIKWLTVHSYSEALVHITLCDGYETYFLILEGELYTLQNSLFAPTHHSFIEIIKRL